MTRRYCLSLGSAFALTVCSVTAQQQPLPAAKNQHILELERQIAGKEQQPAEQIFKNIQILKGMPAVRVLRIMDMAFVPNLGVDCEYCHVPGEWESDVKPPKDIARGMWSLRVEVQERIRKIARNDKIAVTCYTCHKGQPKPAFAPGR
jgi:hypothetical protein